MKEHYYELKYIHNGCETIKRFPADINITDLSEHLRDFLMGAGWGEYNVNKLFNVQE